MWPILFSVPEQVPLIGGMPIFSYGIMLGVSLVVGWYLTLHLTDRDGIARRDAAGTLIVGIVCAMLGARGLHFVANPESFHGWRSFLNFDGGGLVAYGGYLGGLLGGAVWLRLASPVRFWRFVDHGAPAFGLGLALTRIGCYLYGCDFGQRTDGGLGVRFAHWTSSQVPWIGRTCIPDEGGCGPLTFCSPHTLHCEGAGAPAWALHQQLHVADALGSAPVHPVQLYASAAGFALFALTLWLHRRRRFEGQVMLTFLGLYAVVRFILELLREDPERGFVLTFGPGHDAWWHALLVPQAMSDGAGGQLVMHGLSTSQLISLVLGVAVLGAAWWQRAHAPVAPAPHPKKPDASAG